MNNLTIKVGDITTAKVDAIVNAANSAMLGGGGVDGAIHRAAGPGLLTACFEVPEIDGERCPVGEARITSAGLLSARYVIHTVGPVYGLLPDHAQRLQSAFRASLALALEHDCHSIAFPAISAGVYGYPMADVARLALEVFDNPRYAQLEIAVYLIDEVAQQVWLAALAGYGASAAHL